MIRRSIPALIAAIVCLMLTGIGSAHAACTLPNTISNGQIADATPVMDDFNALVACVTNPDPRATFQISGTGGGTITVQNPSATSDYNFNLPATAGNAGNLLTSGGGGLNPETWTQTGTSGHVLPYVDGSNTWSGTQTFGPVVGSVSTQGGTAYTLAAADCGTTILFTSSSTITLTTLNSLPSGCSVAIEQGGNGQVVVAAGTGTSQHSAHGFTKTYGVYAILGLFVDLNADGATADIVITGDGA